MHPNLRTFLDLLTRENEIVTVEAEVDPYLELAEVHRRVIDRQGPALLFKRVKGSRYPVVTNLFGTKRRIDLAFGPKPEAIVRELVQVAESLLPPRPSELWKHRVAGRRVVTAGNQEHQSCASNAGGRSTGATRSVAGVDYLAGGRWPVHYPSSRLH